MKLAYIHYLAGDAPALSHAHQFTAAARAAGHHIDILAPAAEKTEFAAGGQTKPSALRRWAARYSRELRLALANLPRRSQQIEALRRLAPDVVLARQELLTNSHVLAARALGLPLVLEVNAPVSESREYFGEYWHVPALAEWMEKKTLQAADGIFTVSTPLARHLSACAEQACTPPVVVPNGVDTALFDASGPRDPAADGLRERVVIGFVGSFQHFHHIDLLSELVDRIAATREEVGFLFVGDGPDADGIRRRAEALGDRALFVGRTEHRRVPAFVRAMDIAVLPGTADYCSPLKIMEWMSSGCAVVAPRTEPLQDTMIEGQEGLLFEPGQIDSFCAAVDRLIEDPGLRRSLGAAAAERARATMSWDENARRVLKVCEAAREGHARGRGRGPATGHEPGPENKGHLS